MSAQPAPIRKITVSLPARLVAFADREAARLGVSRSSLIASALAQMEAADRDRLAAEGYRFYAEESADFAEACSTAVMEAWTGAG
jgi:metal-responsive CopG/Arc/MetJ family transcriptional regulator